MEAALQADVAPAVPSDDLLELEDLVDTSDAAPNVPVEPAAREVDCIDQAIDVEPAVPHIMMATVFDVESREVVSASDLMTVNCSTALTTAEMSSSVPTDEPQSVDSTIEETKNSHSTTVNQSLTISEVESERAVLGLTPPADGVFNGPADAVPPVSQANVFETSTITVKAADTPLIPAPVTLTSTTQETVVLEPASAATSSSLPFPSRSILKPGLLQRVQACKLQVASLTQSSGQILSMLPSFNRSMNAPQSAVSVAAAAPEAVPVKTVTIELQITDSIQDSANCTAISSETGASCAEEVIENCDSTPTERVVCAAISPMKAIQSQDSGVADDRVPVSLASSDLLVSPIKLASNSVPTSGVVAATAATPALKIETDERPLTGTLDPSPLTKSRLPRRVGGLTHSNAPAAGSSTPAVTSTVSAAAVTVPQSHKRHTVYSAVSHNIKAEVGHTPKRRTSVSVLAALGGSGEKRAVTPKPLTGIPSASFSPSQLMPPRDIQAELSSLTGAAVMQSELELGGADTSKSSGLMDVAVTRATVLSPLVTRKRASSPVTSPAPAVSAASLNQQSSTLIAVDATSAGAKRKKRGVQWRDTLATPNKTHQQKLIDDRNHERKPATPSRPPVAPILKRKLHLGSASSTAASAVVPGSSAGVVPSSASVASATAVFNNSSLQVTRPSTFIPDSVAQQRKVEDMLNTGSASSASLSFATSSGLGLGKPQAIVRPKPITATSSTSVVSTSTLNSTAAGTGAPAAATNGTAMTGAILPAQAPLALGAATRTIVQPVPSGLSTLGKAGRARPPINVTGSFADKAHILSSPAATVRRREPSAVAESGPLILDMSAALAEASASTSVPSSAQTALTSTSSRASSLLQRPAGFSLGAGALRVAPIVNTTTGTLPKPAGSELNSGSTGSTAIKPASSAIKPLISASVLSSSASFAATSASARSAASTNTAATAVSTAVSNGSVASNTVQNKENSTAGSVAAFGAVSLGMPSLGKPTLASTTSLRAPKPLAMGTSSSLQPTVLASGMVIPTEKSGTSIRLPIASAVSSTSVKADAVRITNATNPSSLSAPVPSVGISKAQRVVSATAGASGIPRPTSALGMAGRVVAKPR